MQSVGQLKKSVDLKIEVSRQKAEVYVFFRSDASTGWIGGLELGLWVSLQWKNVREVTPSVVARAKCLWCDRYVQ